MDQLKSGIYKIQSVVKPERVYIGSASNLSSRKSEHLIGKHPSEQTKNKISMSLKLYYQNKK
jgi:hypothetical protein